MSSLKGWKKVNTWRVKGPLLAVAFLVGIFDHAWHLGGASFAAGIAVILPIIGFRDLWNTSKFWLSVAALAVLQVPVVVALRPFVSGFPLLFAFAVVDCALVIAGISVMCRNNGDDARRGVGNDG
jgi:hypothetical protein